MTRPIEFINPAARAAAIVTEGNGVYKFAPYKNWHNATEVPGARVLAVPESRRAFSHAPTERLQIFRFSLEVPEVEVLEASFTPRLGDVDPVGTFTGRVRRPWTRGGRTLRTLTDPEETASRMEEIIEDVWTAHPTHHRRYLASLNRGF